VTALLYDLTLEEPGHSRIGERTFDYGPPGRLGIEIDGVLVRAIGDVSRADAELTEIEGSLLAQLKAIEGHERLGFHFGDLVREVLKMNPRTARNRIALFEVLESRPKVREAFMAGRVSAGQILALRHVLTGENEGFWIPVCRDATVSDLVAMVRERTASQCCAPSEDVEDHEELLPISFEASPVVRLAWERSMDTARKVLGWDAPTYRCVEAVLAEAAPGACAEAPLVSRGKKRVAARFPADRGHDEGPVPAAPARAVRRARETLTQVAEMLDDLESLIERTSVAEPKAIVNRLKSLRGLERPLRVFLGRLLRDIRSTGALYRLGYDRLEDFAESHLHLSERATRDLVRECEVFADCPSLEAAFATGRIGLRQALLIERHSRRDFSEDFVAPGETVTCRQFSREMRLVEKFGDLGLRRYARPLPQPGLFARLAAELVARGWSGEGLADELASGGFEAHAQWLSGGRVGACPFDEEDPAATSLAPLEILVDLLILSTFDEDDPRTLDVRQTFSVGDRIRPERSVRFRAPEPIARHWFGALREIRLERGLLPTWACVMLLLKRAVDAWTAHDPEATPTHRKVLERDGYLCQVPGCSSRRNLEVHHIKFRSRGGGNEASNRITLCHAHHAHMLHMGHVRVRGEAPHALRWEMGCDGKAGGLLRLRGEKLV